MVAGVGISASTEAPGGGSLRPTTPRAHVCSYIACDLPEKGIIDHRAHTARRGLITLIVSPSFWNEKATHQHCDACAGDAVRR